MYLGSCSAAVVLKFPLFNLDRNLSRTLRQGPSSRQFPAFVFSGRFPQFIVYNRVFFNHPNVFLPNMAPWLTDSMMNGCQLVESQRAQ